MIHEHIKIWDDRDDCILHTYISVPAPSVKKDSRMPAMIVCPGGAYLMCSMDNEGEPVVRSFMNAGYQVFCLQYSVAEKAGGRNIQFPQQLLELGKAMLIIKEHSDEWGIDPDRISIVGFSAGANLCGLYATRWHDDILSNYFKKDPSCFKPMAALLGYGLLDYEYQFKREAAAGGNPLMVASAINYLGTDSPSEERLKEVSPICHVSENTVPVFMFHAANDNLVFVENSIHFAAELSNKNIPFELHIFQDGDHGFGTGIRLGAQAHRTDCALGAHDWMELSQKWLLKIAEPELAEISMTSPAFYEKYDVEIPEYMKDVFG